MKWGVWKSDWFMVDMYVQSVMDRKDLGTLLCDIEAAFSI